ncbi:hypothetical protein [Marixanthomonas spongiae]|uniref:DUF4890 domain-containing protein n=1 Tax=Marixanthomonas spongiae TaxID=2174845 RepID=A0A2U0HZQ2_9FLAO|nr:hypothetical protein [Marixanthomonas spongiae]PVW14334.1 hypothetical protein DDV96_11080 [Marixanthomonas spongiae]
MKNVLIIYMAILGFSATAQRHEAPKSAPKAELKQNLTAEQKAALRTKKMTLALDLTEKQQKEVKQLFLKEAKARKTVKKDRKNQKKLSATERFERKSQVMDKRIAHKKEMKSILTEAQYTKWERFAKKRMKRRKQKRKDHQNHG